MKPQELQIGDWVMPDQCITPRLYTSVAMITTDGVYMNEAERRFAFDEIHPIPLDAEILQKNGFIGKEIYVAVFDQAHGDDYDYGVALDYVHELQHALRICNSDKEIVL